MEVDLEDLFDSLDSRDDWTRRGIVKLIIMANEFKMQEAEIEVIIEKIRWRISFFTLLGVLFSTFGTVNVAISMIKDFIEINDSYEEQIQIVRFCLIVIGFVFNLLTSLLIAYLKVKAYEETLQELFECSSGYVRLINQINIELYKKAKFRGSMGELLKTVQCDYERLQKVHVSLNMENSVRRFPAELEEKERLMIASAKKRVSLDCTLSTMQTASEEETTSRESIDH